VFCEVSQEFELHVQPLANGEIEGEVATHVVEGGAALSEEVVDDQQHGLPLLVEFALGHDVDALEQLGSHLHVFECAKNLEHLAHDGVLELLRNQRVFPVPLVGDLVLQLDGCTQHFSSVQGGGGQHPEQVLDLLVTLVHFVRVQFFQGIHTLFIGNGAT